MDEIDNKIKVILQRTESSEDGTLGILMCDDFTCFTMEPPWRSNLPNLSCIPEGKYLARWHYSPRYRWVYNIVNVPDRSHILIHSGNVGGNVDDGLKTHTHGCILLGSKRGELLIEGKRQKAVLNSKPTVRTFFELMNEQLFSLEIR